ncbi:MAG: sigma-70 family RNA polymerase sigma factor [Alicyclobacillaceae bacterium]|nr:sigma-70 family RNA polymerase sigma factor [Alicyclobacillaceae bacterium]
MNSAPMRNHLDSMQENMLQQLEEWMELYGSDVIRFAYSYLHDYHQSEDIAQEVFLKALSAMDNFRNESSPRTWLLAITANSCRDFLRSAKVRHETTQDVELLQRQSSHEVESETVARLMKDELWKTIKKIPIKYREVLVLYYQRELSSQQIADILAISEPSVRTRLHRARILLKEELVKEGVWDGTEY